MAKRWLAIALSLGLAVEVVAQAPPAPPANNNAAPSQPPANGAAPALPAPPGAGGMQAPPTGAVPHPGGPFMPMMPPPGPPPGPGAGPHCPPNGPYPFDDNRFLNGFYEAPPVDVYVPRVWLSAEYMILFMQDPSMPGILTTGDVGDNVPGAAGQPSTVALDRGGRDYEPFSAGRFSGGVWITPLLSFESNYFIAEQQSNIYNASSDGSQLLTRPFFNPITNGQDADPRALPGVFSGSTSSSLRARLSGAEAFFRYGQPAVDYYCPQFSFLVGFRYLRFDERFLIADAVDPLPPLADNSFRFQEEFSVYNEFYGPEVGTKVRFRDQNFTIDIQGKLAVGPNRQELTIAGATAVTQPTGRVLVDSDQALYAQPSNIGRYQHIPTVWVPEVSVDLGLDLTERCRVKVGYTFIWISDVARPTDQINQIVNIQPINAPSQIGPAVPTFGGIRQRSMWIQWVNFGLEFFF